MEIKIDTKEFDRFRKMLRDSPKQARYAARNTLNDIAREVRNQVVLQKNLGMTIRNKTLVRKSITYKKAELNTNWELMRSHTLSSGIADRFTGFGEQETGIRHKRKRFATKKGRRTKKSVIPIDVRANQNFPVVQHYIGRKNLKSVRNVMAYFNRLANNPSKFRSKFGTSAKFMTTQSIQFGGKKLPAGIHQFGISRKGNYKTTFHPFRPTSEAIFHKIDTLQVTPDNKSKLQPKETKWLTKNVTTYFKSKKQEISFATNITKQMELVKKYRK